MIALDLIFSDGASHQAGFAGATAFVSCHVT